MLASKVSGTGSTPIGVACLKSKWYGIDSCSVSFLFSLLPFCCLLFSSLTGFFSFRKRSIRDRFPMMSEGIYIAAWHQSECAQRWLAIATKILLIRYGTTLGSEYKESTNTYPPIMHILYRIISLLRGYHSHCARNVHCYPHTMQYLQAL
jgi:hypothetical protein